MTQFRAFARAGDVGFVAGLVGRDATGQPTAGVRAQTARILQRLASILDTHGAGVSDVVRLRVFLTDVGDWPRSVLPELAEVFDGDIPPCTVVGVSGLVEDWMCVEIEAEVNMRAAAL